MSRASLPQPRDRLREIGLVLAALGAVDALYLTWIKLAHVQALCTSAGGCETVNTSVYSEIRGVPIALFGLAAYLALVALFALETRLLVLQDYAPLAVFGLALTGTLYSAYLTYVELFVLHAVCPYCVTSALLITGIFILSVVRLARGPLGAAVD
jgi:uncharacterized membrane protein